LDLKPLSELFRRQDVSVIQLSRLDRRIRDREGAKPPSPV
jgi:hypothetical protein